jgi:valyl-tRNA synthetase
MMMLGLFCTDTEPFHTVYLHGMIRAEGGVKMSKTKGNSVDPLGMVEEIGADALRFALINSSAPGSDQRLTQAKLDGGRNFTNKLWNAARFVLANQPDTSSVTGGTETLAMRWIGSRLADATERATRHLDALDLGGYAATIYEVAWSDYCDWFLEMAKVDLRRDDADAAARAATWQAAADGLGTILRLLHPLMPFVTEEIWAALADAAPNVIRDEPLLIRAAWPAPGPRNAEAERAFGDLAELVRAVRNLRTHAGTPAGAWVPLGVATLDPAARLALEASGHYVQSLARVRPVTVRTDAERPEAAAATPLGAVWLEAGVASGATADQRSAKIAELDRNIARVRELLANDGFVGKAPADVVERERERLAGLEAQRRQLGDG